MTDDSLGKVRIIASEEKMRQAILKLDRFKQLSHDELVDMVIAGIFNERVARGFVTKIRESQKLGNSTSSLLNLRDEILLAIADSFRIADKEMGLSAIGAMVFEVHDGHPAWSIFNPNILVDNFRSPGEFGYINGLPGAGKTNFACVIIQQWLQSGCVISNIRMKSPTPNYYFIHKFTALLKAIVEIRKENRNWLLVLDETGLYWLKAQAQRGTNIGLDKFLRILRKLGGCLIAIEQREEGISSTLQAFSTQHFLCIKPPGLVNIDLKGPVHKHNTWIKEFPQTSLPFDTNDPAYLDLNVDIDELFEVLSGGNPLGDLENYLNRKK